MYNVVVAPHLAEELIQYATLLDLNHGELCSARFIKSYGHAVASLQFMPQRGTRRLASIPEKYRTIPFWKHLWLIYQINKESQTVHIVYQIDDHTDYGKLIM